MKTLKNISVFSLVMIFAAVNSAFSGTGKPVSTETNTRTSKYQVNVHLGSDLTLCNIYLVEIVDEYGLLVAPAQTFIAGTGIYTFIGKPSPIGVLGSPGWESKRTALLVEAGSGEVICTADLVTRPDSQTGTFAAGRTYYFNLFPNKVTRKLASDPVAKD
jgi:hypothetical protein